MPPPPPERPSRLVLLPHGVAWVGSSSGPTPGLKSQSAKVKLMQGKPGDSGWFAGKLSIMMPGQLPGLGSIPTIAVWKDSRTIASRNKEYVSVDVADIYQFFGEAEKATKEFEATATGIVSRIPVEVLKVNQLNEQYLSRLKSMPEDVKNTVLAFAKRP